MKNVKIALFSIICLAFFAGCDNGIHNRVASNPQDTGTVICDVSDILSSVANSSRGAANSYTPEYTAYLTAIKGITYSETLNAQSGNVSFKIENIEVGTEVQFQLKITKNGFLVYDGTSDVATIEIGSNVLEIKMKGKSLVLPVWGDTEDGDFAYYNIDYLKCSLNTPLKASESYIDNNFFYDWQSRGKIIAGTNDTIFMSYTDKYSGDPSTDGLYYIKKDQTYKKVKSASLYNIPIVAVDSSTNKTYAYLEERLDSDYYVHYLSEFDESEETFKNVASLKGSSWLGADEIPESEVSSTFAYDQGYIYDENESIAVNKDCIYVAGNYNDYYLFVRKDRITSEEGVSEGLKKIKIEKFQKLFSTEEGEESGPLAALGGVSEELKVKDIAYCDGKLYILARTGNEAGHEFRGLVIVLNAEDLSLITTIGWTNTASYVDSLSETSFYSPKSIKDGFYGPLKILAIKPEELIFVDSGTAVKEEYNENFGMNRPNSDYQRHLVSVNLKDKTWKALKVGFDYGEQNGLCGF